MLNVIIQTKDGNTLVEELPRSMYDLYEHLLSVRIDDPPQKIKLTDNEDDNICVKLYADNEIGKHLVLLLNEENTLADANLLAQVLTDINSAVKEELEQNILYDQYQDTEDLYTDIKKMIDHAAPFKVDFYCPLIGEVIDDENLSSSVDGRYLKHFQWAIEEALEIDFDSDKTDMAEYFDESDDIKAKLLSVKWGVEEYRGRLFGKIKCSLKEELTEAETEIITAWITGQNADGWGEHFEQQPIEIEDGKLFVSFWNSGDHYSVMTHDVLDEYIGDEGMMMGGM